LFRMGEVPPFESIDEFTNAVIDVISRNQLRGNITHCGNRNPFPGMLSTMHQNPQCILLLVLDTSLLGRLMDGFIPMNRDSKDFASLISFSERHELNEFRT